MQLYEELLITILAKQNIQISFPDLKGVSAVDLIEATSYQALTRIQKIIQDDSLTDPECFVRIEEVVRVLERLGCDTGNRHDF